MGSRSSLADPVRAFQPLEQSAFHERPGPYGQLAFHEQSAFRCLLSAAYCTS